MREISPADYDAAMLAAPDDCPLLCVAGDCRSGAELLAGLEADARHAARAVGSACWAEQLDRLAAVLGPRLELGPWALAEYSRTDSTTTEQPTRTPTAARRPPVSQRRVPWVLG